MNPQRALLQKSYGLTAEAYTAQTDGIILDALLERFCTLVPNGHILDIGCAGGRDLAIFESRGYAVTGLEITPELAQIARSRIHGQVLLEDIVDGDVSVEPVDGIWSIGVYHHFPRSSIVQTTKNMRDLLKEGGAVVVSTKRGDGERTLPDARYGGVLKYWSFYQPEELKRIYAQAGFKEIAVEEDGDIWLNIIAR